MLFDASDRALIDGWQRDFPIAPAPFAEIGAALGLSEADVLTRLSRLQASGALSRVGAVVRPNTVGASTLAALAAPAEMLEEVAAAVIAEPGVNHAYEREHRYNLWFVVTAPDADGVAMAIARIEARTGMQALVLPLLQDFHIDLGFSIFGTGPLRPSPRGTTPAVVERNDRQLLGAIENGLDLVDRPFQQVARRIGWSERDVLVRLSALIESGVVSRFGIVLRHRHFGYAANAMVVWDIPDDALDRIARSFAAHDFVTLCYERPRRAGWPYNLFTMIHGREREAALAHVEQLAALAPEVCSRDVLFSQRCFRQRGARLSAA